MLCSPLVTDILKVVFIQSVIAEGLESVSDLSFNRDFHTNSAIQECQHCQLGFSSAIENQLVQ